MRCCTAATASLSGISVSALTRVTRSMFLRSICTGPASRVVAITLRAGTTWPLGVFSSTSPTSEISSRSASRSRTTIGYSLPRSRNCAAVVPATLV